MINMISPPHIIKYTKHIFTKFRYSSLSSQWWFHGPSGTISSLIRQAIVKPSKHDQLISKYFHRYKAYKAPQKSLVSAGKEKFRFKDTIFSSFSTLSIL